MIYYILTFILGFIIGALGTWVYNQVTDKVMWAKTGYSLGKRLLLFIFNKVKKASAIIKQFLGILSGKFKIRFVLNFIAIRGASLLETLSVSLLLPYV